MDNTNEYVLTAINELTRDLEKTNAKLRRVRFMTKVYLGIALYYAYRLHKESEEKKEDKE